MGEKGAYSTMIFIELSQEQQRIVFTQASAQTGININLAEKDWWICQVLSALYKLPSAEHTSFKGGTSLSKCWKLIDRISEDIDIGIDRISRIWRNSVKDSDQRQTETRCLQLR